MFITDLVSITELSRITQKSRPTIYKYISDYKMHNYDDIPYTFIQLLKISESDTTTHLDIVRYCKNIYGEKNITDREMLDIIDLLENNKGRLNLEKIKTIILEEINNARG